jgi:hypothetical protein
MASWGNDPSSVTNKPKFLLDNEVTKYRREDSYATNQGWVMRAGSPATGNGNINAAPEILVAIGGLAGLSANAGFKQELYTDFPEGGGIILNSTDGTANAGDDLLLEAGDGLGTPNITDVRFITSAPAGGSSKTVTVEVTWDEGITVAGSPQVTVANNNAGSGSGRACVLTYSATGSSANRKRFTATNITVAEDDVLSVGAATGSLALNSGTLSDTEMGGTTVPAFLSLTDTSAVTQTVTG